MSAARISMPSAAKRGEIIEIRAIVSHHMETGFRRTERGAGIPRDIIQLFVCTYNGVELEFRWSGDNGFTLVEKATLQVS
jgi:sulfur-oxidizing protein SoxZ